MNLDIETRLTTHNYSIDSLTHRY